MTAGGLPCDEAATAAATGLLKRLGHPARLAILCRLVEGEMSVAEMESTLGLRQPSLSQQLAELRSAGIIEPRRESKTVFYRLADTKARRLVELLQQMFASTDVPAPVPVPTARAPKPRTTPVGAAVFARVGPEIAPPSQDAENETPSPLTSFGRT
jgi:ArsR family transcriptional regulator